MPYLVLLLLFMADHVKPGVVLINAVDVIAVLDVSNVINAKVNVVDVIATYVVLIEVAFLTEFLVFEIGVAIFMLSFSF